ncbi:UNVERIFIED_CONTAM: hypothetical protein K2H54_049027 [Gekko kuhli]
MASREEDGFLSLQEPETMGRNSGTAESMAEEPNHGTAKRPAAEAPEERNGAAASKHAKKMRAQKEPGSAASAMANYQRHKQKVGKGQIGKNPQKDCPDAVGYSRAEGTGHGSLRSASESDDGCLRHLDLPIRNSPRRLMEERLVKEERSVVEKGWPDEVVGSKKEEETAVRSHAVAMAAVQWLGPT